MPIIYIDADACPVKSEVYKVARRYNMRVVLVANSTMRIPSDELFELVIQQGFDGADNWIVEQVCQVDIVITSDIPLAARCLEKEARVLHPKGNPFTENDIGEALAMRELMDELRQGGNRVGGPAPMVDKDRSRFLAKLDEMVNAVLRESKK